jgi:aminopeptidase
MKQSYKPSDEILAKYAELLVKFGLQTRAGKQLKKGSVVQFTVPEVAKPMYFHLQTAILKCGYQPIGVFVPSNDPDYNFAKNVFDNANKDQLAFYAEKYHKGIIEQVDGTIYIIAETDPNALADVDPKKIMARAAAMKPAKDLRFKKIDAGKMSWTLGLYGTDAAAKEAGMSTKAYWDQIIKACYLDSDNPVTEWKKINSTVQKTAQKLTDLQIKSVHMVGADVDLHVGIGKDRAWRAGGGNNVPSYEVFTSPNFREINGWIKFNQPLLRYGARIEGIELHFKDGKVTKSSATKNEKVLKEMIKNKGGNQVGEYSLTDARLSRITKFMAETLYDENVGGKFGNSHIALGSAYRDCYVGDPTKVSDKKWEKLGYNDSVVHTDIVTTTDRTVTATLYDGTSKVIYEKGQFTV